MTFTYLKSTWVNSCFTVFLEWEFNKQILALFYNNISALLTKLLEIICYLNSKSLHSQNINELSFLWWKIKNLSSCLCYSWLIKKKWIDWWTIKCQDRIAEHIFMMNVNKVVETAGHKVLRLTSHKACFLMNLDSEYGIWNRRVSSF